MVPFEANSGITPLKELGMDEREAVRPAFRFQGREEERTAVTYVIVGVYLELRN